MKWGGKMLETIKGLLTTASVFGLFVGIIAGFAIFVMTMGDIIESVIAFLVFYVMGTFALILLIALYTNELKGR